MRLSPWLIILPLFLFCSSAKALDFEDYALGFKMQLPDEVNELPTGGNALHVFATNDRGVPNMTVIIRRANSGHEAPTPIEREIQREPIPTVTRTGYVFLGNDSLKIEVTTVRWQAGNADATLAMIKNSFQSNAAVAGSSLSATGRQACIGGAAIVASLISLLTLSRFSQAWNHSRHAAKAAPERQWGDWYTQSAEK